MACGPDVDTLFTRWRRDGDPAAREALFVRFTPLARRLAARYMTSAEPIDDLAQVAAVGLLLAIDRFEPDRGSAFASFAIPTITGELRRHFRTVAWCAHVPRTAQELALRVQAATQELSARGGRAPRVAELAGFLRLSAEEVRIGLAAARAQYSLSLDAPSRPAGGEAPVALGETVGAVDERYALVDVRLSLRQMAPRLPRQQRRALALRLRDELKQSEIATQLGCSQMNVCRLLRRAGATLHDVTGPAAA